MSKSRTSSTVQTSSDGYRPSFDPTTATSLPAATEQPATIPMPAATRSQSNLRRLDAAQKHLAELFSRAEGTQIDGRPFYGHIAIEIPFQDGAAQQIKWRIEATDRVAGGF